MYFLFFSILVFHYTKKNILILSFSHEIWSIYITAKFDLGLKDTFNIRRNKLNPFNRVPPSMHSSPQKKTTSNQIPTRIRFVCFELPHLLLYFPSLFMISHFLHTRSHTLRHRRRRISSFSGVPFRYTLGRCLL